MSESDNQAAQHWLNQLRHGTLDEQAEARTELGLIFERRGMIDEAAEAYWANVKARVRDRRPYERLSIIARQHGDSVTEARVLVAMDAACGPDLSPRMLDPADRLDRDSSYDYPSRTSPALFTPATRGSSSKSPYTREALTSEQEQLVWAHFPVHFTLWLTAVIFLIISRSASIFILVTYATLVAMRTSIPYGSQGQKLISTITLWLWGPRMTWPLLFVLGLLLASRYLGGITIITAALGLALAVAYWVTLTFADTVVRTIFSPTTSQHSGASIGALRPIIGVLARIAFWLFFLIILLDAVVGLWRAGFYVEAVFALLLSPLTFFAWPIWTSQWWVLVLALLAYATSTLIGRLPPIR